MFFTINVKATVVDTYAELKYGGQQFSAWDIYRGAGNSKVSLNLLANYPFTSGMWLKGSIVYCSNAAVSGGIDNTNGYIKNIKHSYSDYTCTYANGIKGKVYMIIFEAYFSEESGGEFNGSFTVYNDPVNLQLIDFFLDTSNFANINDYSSQSNIESNSKIINQNTTIIGQNDAILARQQETNDKLGETNSKLDDIQNRDISDSDKELPDDSDYDDYEEAQGDLTDKISSAELDNLEIGIDSDSSNFIWDTMQKCLNSHPYIFSTFLAILSIGIIKFALGR